jgi:glycine/D-amino acid oxidase-like deaminating enzyme
LHIDRQNSRNKVTGLETRNSNNGACDTIEADIVVFAMGAWTTDHLKHIIPDEYQCSLPTVQGLKVHSIVLRGDKEVSEDALFLRHGSLEPEVYPRPDGTVYICGVQSDEPLPALASMVEPEADAIRYLRGSVAGMVSEALGEQCDLVQSQACYLPCSSSNKPIIGELPGIDGAFVAAGHSCWGILLGPGTGFALAQVILESLVAGEESHHQSGIDLGPFKP